MQFTVITGFSGAIFVGFVLVALDFEVIAASFSFLTVTVFLGATFLALLLLLLAAALEFEAAFDDDNDDAFDGTATSFFFFTATTTEFLGAAFLTSVLTLVLDLVLTLVLLRVARLVGITGADLAEGADLAFDVNDDEALISLSQASSILIFLRFLLVEGVVTSSVTCWASSLASFFVGFAVFFLAFFLVGERDEERDDPPALLLLLRCFSLARRFFFAFTCPGSVGKFSGLFTMVAATLSYSRAASASLMLGGDCVFAV